MTSTRVIALPHDLQAAPAERPKDRHDAAGPSRAQVTVGRSSPPNTSSPGHAALVAIAKLLGRQAAEEHFRSQGE
jgi:hypothetical protein